MKHVDNATDIPAQKIADIEITPQMVEAGAKLIWAVFDEVVAYGSPVGRELAKEVFVAMVGKTS